MMTSADILLVDDDPGIESAVGDRLRIEGYKVRTAVTAEAALDSIRRVRPDLLILDIGLPGMSGMGLLKQITGPDMKPACPVLIFTARSHLEPFFDSVPVDGFVVKSGDPDRLLAEVSRILLRKPPAPARRNVTLLLAEDDSLHGGALRGYFGRNGFEVNWAKDGTAALEEVLRDRPDAVVVKRILPRMNGNAVAQALRRIASTRDLPVVLYDGSGLTRLDQTYPEATRFVRSADPEPLLEAVREVLPASRRAQTTGTSV